MLFLVFSLDTSNYVSAGSRLRRCEVRLVAQKKGRWRLHYSAFRTWIGSTLAARLAGSRVATAATAMSIRAITT